MQGAGNIGFYDSFLMNDYSVKKDANIDQYLKGQYNNYLNENEHTSSIGGLALHNAGVLINDFKLKNPKTTDAISLTFESASKPFEWFGEYVLRPALNDQAALGDAIYDIVIGKENKKALYQKERELWKNIGEYFDNHAKGYTPEQKIALGMEK